jgi:pimeloyl-ACP methyl ester carboxylesterase
MTVSLRIPRTHRAVLSAVLLALACLALAARPGDAAAAPTAAWSPCYVQVGPFECSTVRVPLDYDHPDGETIPIALTRLPATDPGRKIGSLFVNPGGPGGSGVDFVVGLGKELYTPEVRARFDIVGFDPRGIMRSSGLRCFGTPKQWGSAVPPFAFPTTPAEEAQTITADRYVDHACEARGTRVLDHMSTANVARDLDVLRSAVGDDELSYAGYSYGSYLGVTYANLFPDRVRAVIVDGVVDPIAWSTGHGDDALTLPFSTRLRGYASAQATLDEFFRLCDAAGPACAFSGGSAARFAALAERARQAPLELVFPDGSKVPLRYSDLIGISLGAMYTSSAWRDYAQLLATIEQYSSPAAVGARVSAFMAKYGPSLYPNFVEGGPAVACEDSDNPDGYGAWSTAGAQADTASYFGRIWTWSWSVCAEWKAFDSGRYMGPFTKTTANPLLVVGTRFDPATPYEGAVTVHDLMPDSALLTVNGWGHTSLFLSKCADSAVENYLIDLARPAAGTECNQDADPFAAATAATAATDKRLKALSYVNGRSSRSVLPAPRGGALRWRARPRAAGPSWADLSGSAVDALGAQTGVDDRGNAVYAWSSSDPATGKVRVQARTRSASGRLGPVLALSDPAVDAFDVHVAVNARGAAVFSWLEADAAGSALLVKTRSRSARGALGPAATVSEPGRDAFEHMAAITGNGDAIVTWTSLDNDTGSADVKARWRSAAGALGPVLAVGDPALDSFGPQVAVNALGDATLAWTLRDPATGRIRAQTRTGAAGGDLGPTVDLSDPARNAGDVDVAVAPDGDAVFDWIVVNDETLSGSAQARSRPRGRALGAIVDLSSPSDDAWDPAVGVADDGDAELTWWVPDRAGARVEARSLSARGTTGPRVTLSDGADDGFEPDVAVAGDGRAVYTWLAFDSRGVRVQARSRSPRGVLGPAANLTGPSEDAFSAQVAITGDGDAVFGWSAVSGAGYQVLGRSRSAGGTLGPLATISTTDRDAFEAGINRTSDRMEAIADAR